MIAAIFSFLVKQRTQTVLSNAPVGEWGRGRAMERDSACEKLTALLAFRLIQMKMDELLNVVIVAVAASSASNGMSAEEQQ